MNKQEVIKLIGKEHWSAFNKWMYGQTVGLNEDGTTDYYTSDVERFHSYVKRKWIL